MNASNCKLKDIIDSQRKLVIPYFQRPYVWQEDQWERFMEDMQYITQSQCQYFLGSVILKQQPTSATEAIGDVRTVIDGQQRLTTITIFFKVLALKFNKNGNFTKNFQIEDTDDPVICHSHIDRDYFKRVVNLVSLENFPESDIKSSKILSAYTFFKDNFDKYNFDYNVIKNNMNFVCIDLNYEDDEQRIFDTVNSVGVVLSTADLLKNYFFNEDSLSDYEKYWKDVFEKDEETRSYWDTIITAGRLNRCNLDVLLYSFLMIKLQDKSLSVKTEDKQRYGKYDGLFDNYKQFIKNYHTSMGCGSENECKLILAKELKDYAVLYRNSFDPIVAQKELTNEYGLERINAIIYGLDNTTIIPYILYFLRNQNDAEEQKKMFKVLESYLMRRMVCKLSNKNYNNFFSEKLIGNSVLTASSLVDVFFEKEDVNNYPSNEEVVTAFHNSVLVNKQATGVLYMIESFKRNSVHSTILRGVLNYSLEHMMPKKWRNNWDIPPTDELCRERNFRLLTLGNLTIISLPLNTSIRDANWTDKKNGRGKHKGLIAYAGEIEIMSDALGKDNWTENDIKERADYLAGLANQVWDISEFTLSL